MVAGKRKTKKDENPQLMLGLGWDGVSQEDDGDPEEANPVEDEPGVVESMDPPETASIAVRDLVAEEQSRLDAANGVDDDTDFDEEEGEAGGWPTEFIDEDTPETPVDEVSLKIGDSWAAAPEPVPAPEFEPEPDPEPVSLPPLDSSASVGERLRRARLAAGLTVTRVAEETCLRNQFIDALENGRYEDMLPLAFSRSYVRRLCELYCLPEGQIVKDFVAEYEKHQGPRQGSSFFHVAPDGDEGASKVSYVPTGVLGDNKEGRSLTVGGIVAGLMVLVAVALSVTTVTTLVMRHLHGKAASIEDQADPGTPAPLVADKPAAPSGEGLPPVDARQFILPEELPLDELPIPK